VKKHSQIHPRLSGNRHVGGFTLIELLVAIAMIAVLSALLLPALTSAKSAAHSVKCKSNLKQLGLALNLYVNDFHCYPQSDWNGRIWSEPLNACLRQAPNPRTNTPPYGGVFLCPSDLERRLRAGRWSYGYNAFGVVSGTLRFSTGTLGLGVGLFLPLSDGTSFSSRDVRPTQETEVKVPSDMIAMADAFSGAPDITANNFTGTPDKTSLIEGEAHIARIATGFRAGDTLQFAQTRHRGRLNVTFCDGHVEAFRPQSLFFDETDAAYKRWNRDHEVHRGVPPW
jgi:prepilin-type processing-associated H-X9-DG protein/prepilin-type N-terminal cleavage/methylation domain-containing protein